MENNNKHPEGCQCALCEGGKCEGCPYGYCSHYGPCGWGHGGRWGHRHLVGVLIGIIILIVVFWCGFRLGELMSYVRGGSYGRYGMMRSGEYPQQMMDWYWQNGGGSNATSTAQ